MFFDESWFLDVDVVLFQTASSCDVIHWHSLYASAGDRDMIASGVADFIPNYFHQVPRLVSEFIQNDVCITSVSPMDENGYIVQKNNTETSVKGVFTAGGTATAEIRIANDGSTIPSDGVPKSFVISSVQNEENAVHHYLDSNNQKTTVESYTSDASNTPFEGGDTARTEDTGYYNYSTTNNTLVTNLEYEREVNEDKHLIRYIEPMYISRVVKEFREIVRD